MKKLFLLSLFCVFSMALYCQPLPITQKLQEFSADSSMKNALLGFYLINSDNGEKLVSTEPQKGMATASVLKVITTATALEVFGPDYRFHTRLYYNGTIDTITHTLNGNLIIRGGGDPALGSHYFKDQYKDFIANWIKAIQTAGIQHVHGAVIADPSIYRDQSVPGTWVWEDLGNYYGAGATGLNIFDNLYAIHFSSPATSGRLTRITGIEPQIQGLTITNHVFSAPGKEDEAYIFGGPEQFHKTVRGTIPCHRADFTVKGSMPDPPLFAAQYFEQKLNEAGIKADSTARIVQQADTINNRNTFLTETLSPPLIDIIRMTNVYSINLFAEQLMKQLGLQLNGEGSTKTGTKAILDFWTNHGIDTQGMFIVDGCGLSRFNSVSAEQIARILQYMRSSSKYSTEFYNSLPSGHEGTIQSLFKDHPTTGEFHIKSGTISRVKSYAGYYSNNGKHYTFCILTNNYIGSTKRITDKIASFLSQFDQQQ